MRKLLFGIAGLVVLIVVALAAFLFLVTRDFETAPLGDGEKWFDDWYTITEIDSQTFAVGEPRYWQKNYNYLLLGDSRAILFDTGPGVRDIKPVVESLTDLPITVASSHWHYDHIGNNHRFDRIAAIDVLAIRSRVEDGVYHPSYSSALTLREIRPYRIVEWWQPGEVIDIGERWLQVLHVPGHADGSMALLDERRKQLFTGDIVYPGWLVGFAPSTDLRKYLSSARHLIAHTSGSQTLYGAHAVENHPSPVLPHAALSDLESGLDRILAGRLAGRGRFPMRVYPINADMEMLTWYFSEPGGP
jgi:glyoxylase-like metal-dependent hydrolase (beta-lactamase superfamily II)